MDAEMTPQPIPKKINQSDVFLESEGDKWFERNQEAIHARSSFHEIETIKRVLRSFKDGIGDVLEIGCANGDKLYDLCTHLQSSGSGIDPSAAAIRDGRERYGDLNLSVGKTAELPFGDKSFGLVYFGFCLYLIDRDEVFKTVAEADRVLRNGGFLAIVDFDPKVRHKRAYHHRSGLFSFKTSYADFFTSGGHYYLVAKDSFSIATDYFSIDSDERVSVSILYKESDPF
jgi:ubiquinone/menaquinone biosynthesis C-methylase UbiE